MTMWHLVKRLVASVTATPLTGEEQSVIAAVLMPCEEALFRKLSTADARHAISVLRRFDADMPHASLTARRAALLHDIGKIDDGMGTMLRVIATIVGPRVSRFRTYHSHEQRGIELLEVAGSDPETLAYLRGAGDSRVVEALRRADDI